MMATNTDAPKRTRTNVKQSKFGCFTCKARRVKCDEAKPSCRRCLNAKRRCLGYPSNAPLGLSPSTVSTSASLSPSHAPSSSATAFLFGPFTITPSNDTNSFVDLARTVLVQSPRRARNNLELSLWSTTVPQLTHSVPSVRAAVEAFGACYKEYVLGLKPTNPGRETRKRYTHALKLVQDDLSTLQCGPLPCVIACLFLACIETLQQQLENGHVHLLGAFSLLASLKSDKMSADVDVASVLLLLQKLDLHIATYSVDQPPHLPPIPAIAKDILLSDPPDQALFRIIHPSYHFTAKAFPYKYSSRRLIPPEMLIEQGRHLGNMKQWLDCNSMSSSWTAGPHIEDESLLVLRAQCLAALIYTANIFDPRETAYDCYSLDFEEIINLIETLSLSKDHRKTSGFQYTNTLPAFMPDMGIIQPLYFTALKYRNAFWRRKALQLLSGSGKEGPWCGETDGSVVAATIRIEEGLSRKAPLTTKGHHDSMADNPSNVSEKDRVNLCWAVDTPERRDLTQNHGKRFTRVIINRCVDIEGMLREDGQQLRKFPWQDSNHWETWIQQF